MTLAPFPKRKYGPDELEPIYEPQSRSFELDEDWLSILAKEFDMQKMAADFAQAIAGKSKSEVEKIAELLFREYGTNLMKRSLQLGEEYMDRTYEVLKAACDKTSGYLTWPLVPQRFIEAAILSTQDIPAASIIINNHDCFQFQVKDCKMYTALEEKCSQEIADSLPCRHGCLAMVQTAFTDLGLGASTTITRTVPDDKCCEFTTIRVKK
ncbi:MAG: hypothetical protein HY665_07190 [Chloroflexi bacterium]|nr:hypothetical protein [Chloroflexota bacterium]